MRFLSLVLMVLCVPFVLGIQEIGGQFSTVEERIDVWHPLVQKSCEGDLQCMALVKAFIFSESAGREFAVSPTGAAGLMQFSYGTGQSYFEGELMKCCEGVSKCNSDTNLCRDAGYTDPRFDPQQSIAAGKKMLMKKYSANDNNIYLTAISYNAGQGVVPQVLERISGEPTIETIAPVLQEALFNSPVWKNREASFVVRRAENLVGYMAKISKKYYEYLGEEEPIVSVSAVPQVPALDDDEVRLDPQRPDLLAKEVDYVPSVTEDFRGVLGMYYVIPGFRVRVPYVLGELDMLRAQIQEMLSCTEDSCLDAKMNLFSSSEVDLPATYDTPTFLWKEGMCEAKRTLFWEVTSQLHACVESEDDLCGCTLTLPRKEGVIHFTMEDGTLHVVDEKSNLHQAYSMHLSYQGDEALPLDSMTLSVHNDGYSVMGSLDGQSIPLSLGVDNTMRIKKSGSEFVLGGVASDSCTLQDTARAFCVQSPQELYTDMRFGSGRMSVRYNFVLRFDSALNAQEQQP